MARAAQDPIFALAGERDPFLNDPYLRALTALDLPDRKRVVHQVTLLCTVVEGLTPLDALEVLAKIALLVEVNR